MPTTTDPERKSPAGAKVFAQLAAHAQERPRLPRSATGTPCRSESRSPQSDRWHPRERRKVLQRRAKQQPQPEAWRTARRTLCVMRTPQHEPKQLSTPQHDHRSPQPRRLHPPVRHRNAHTRAQKRAQEHKHAKEHKEFNSVAGSRR